MTQHVTEFVTMAEQIAEAGMVIQDDLLSIMFWLPCTVARKVSLQIVTECGMICSARCLRVR